MDHTFIVFEIQTNTDGSVGTLVSSFADQNQAESAYHQVLTSAAVSALPKHACVLMTEEGFNIKTECYTHAIQPEPETTTAE